MRFHEVDQVNAILEPGEFNRCNAISVGDIGIRTMSQKKFDHFGRPSKHGLMERRISAIHALPALPRLILLIRVSAKFQKECHHFSRIQKDGHGHGQFASMWIFLIIRIGTSV